MRSSVAAVLFWIFSIVLETDLLGPIDGERFETVSSDELEAGKREKGLFDALCRKRLDRLTMNFILRRIG